MLAATLADLSTKALYHSSGCAGLRVQGEFVFSAEDWQSQAMAEGVGLSAFALAGFGGSPLRDSSGLALNRSPAKRDDWFRDHRIAWINCKRKTSIADESIDGNAPHCLSPVR